jgi:hypothetical protein
MAKEWFEDHNFKPATLRTIAHANRIINTYMAEGYVLSLRQLYYQFVSEDLIENSKRSYDSLKNTMTNARMAGLVDWAAIEDRERTPKSWLIEETERNALKDVEMNFALDIWDRQNVYVEVWVEKAALAPVVRRACSRWSVPYLACKGYVSASEAYNAGKRFEDHYYCDRKVIVHLGDHDPSGIDMTRDNRDRVQMFANDADVEVHRIALNRDQVDQYGPPPNRTKKTDSRAYEYIMEHGNDSWELDALKPQVINDLIDGHIRTLIDEDQWFEDRQEERERRKPLAALYKRFDEVMEFVKGLDNETD